jgi:phage tail-like protein
MATGERVDPFRNYNFIVEIDGIAQAGFQEVSGGLSSEIDVTEYREGGFSPAEHGSTVRKLPGMTKYSNITLKWGLTDSRELYDWHRDVVKGKIERKNGSIVLLDTEGNEAVRWNFANGWPSKWTGSDFNAKSSDVAIETLEIAHEGIERT